MARDAVRIDGWKSIAAHFGRDRTTVMRWARDRDLPVHRVPGGGTASVYAFAADLDRWLARADAEPAVVEVAAEPAPDKPAPPRRRFPRPLLIVAGVAALAGAAAVPFAWREPAAPIKAAMPADPEVAALYLRARDDWATRTAPGLKRAIAEFGQVVSRDPGFAPAYAGLADAYLLVREYGAMPEAQAYPRAEAAANAALALDPDNADAHRARGFIAYWWHRDTAAARDAFARALALDPRSAQTQFWFGNALVGNGEFAAGLRALDRARLLAPGSRAILADHGWALWASGQRAAGKAQLAALAADASPAPHTLLSVIAFAEADYPAYLSHAATAARLRGDPALASRIAVERAAFGQGGARALIATMQAAAAADDDAAGHAGACWSTLLAARAGDRTRLLTALQAAERSGVRWQCGGLVAPMFAAWSGDAEVMRLVARRRGASLISS